MARLEWAGEGPACAAEALASRIEALLGRHVVATESERADLVVRWRIDSEPVDGWNARFDLERPDGSRIGARVLDARGPDCTVVHETLATVLAVAIDVPRRELEIHVVAPEMAAEPPLEPEPLREPEPPSERNGVSGRLSVGAIGALGWLPWRAIGASAVVNIEPSRHWSLRLGGEAWAEGSVESDDVSARARLWTVHAGACLRAWRAGPLDLDACAALFVGVAHATGEGLDIEREASSVLLGADIGAQLDWRIVGPVGLRLDLRARFPVLGGRVVYDAEGTTQSLAELTSVVGMLSVSLFVQLGS